MDQLSTTVSVVAAEARQRGCNLPEVLARLSGSLAATPLCTQAASSSANKQQSQQQQQPLEGAAHSCNATDLQLVATIATAVSDALHNRGSQPLPKSSSSSLTHISTCLRNWIPVAVAAAAAAAEQPPTASAVGTGIQEGQNGDGMRGAAGLDTSAAAAAAAMAAIQAGSQLWPSTWPLLPRPERAAVLSFLASLVSGSCSGQGAGRKAATAPSASAGAAGGEGPQMTSSQGLAIVLALQAALLLGSLLKVCSSSLQPEEVTAIRSAQVEGLAAAAQDWKRCWSREHSALLLELLMGCIAQVQERRKEWPGAASQLAEAVRRLLVYGVGMQEPFPRLSRSSNTPLGGCEEAAAAAPNSSPGSTGAEAGGGRRYVPPHLRSQAAAGKGAASQPPLAATSDTDWSDMSDTSDLEGWTPPGSRRASKSSSSAAAAGGMGATFQRCGRVRATALGLLQAMVRTDPSVLQPHWPSILPSHDPVGARHGSSHLLTVILSDPCCKLRALAASVLTLLLEGPLPRSILAVAEAKSLARPGIRGFTTLSTSLGQMLLALHAGLTHALRAEGDAAALPNLLRALAALAAVSPYERLPPELLPTMVQLLWAYLTTLRPQLFTPQGASSSSSSTSAVAGASVGAGFSGPQQPVAAGDASQADAPLTTAAAAAAAAGGGGGGSSSVPAALTAGLAALAQALSTAKHSSSLEAWLSTPLHTQAARASTHSSNSSLGARGALSRMRFNSLPDKAPGSSSSSSSSSGCLNQGQLLAGGLLTAARTSPVLDAIEAMAALRGLCVHYPCALPPNCWPQILALAQQTLEVSAAAAVSLAAGSALGQRSPSRGPSSRQLGQRPTAGAVGGGGAGAGPSRPGSSCSTRSEVDVSGSTSPEFKATQHGLRLLGDYLTAQRELWLLQQQWEAEEGVDGQAAHGATTGNAGATAVAGAASGISRQPPGTAAGVGTAPAAGGGVAAATDGGAAHNTLAAGLCLQWAQVLLLLLGPLVQGHPSGLVRTAAATVVGLLPGNVWLQLPSRQQAAVLQALVHWVGSDPVTAVRAAAAKSAGTMLHQDNLLAAALDASHCGAGLGRPSNGDAAAAEVPDLLLSLYHQLSVGVRSAAAASINQHAAWAIANVAATVTQLLHDPQGLIRHPLSSHGSTAAGGGAVGEQQLLPEQQQQQEVNDYLLRCIAQLGEGALTAAAGADKVRASGVRGLGALLAAWRPAWSAPPAGSAQALACTGQDPGTQQNQQGLWPQRLPADWPYKALQQVEVCLSKGNMKVQWNAACALGLCLHNPALSQDPLAVALLPQLLASLVGILCTSPNFKVRSHAAAALEVLPNLDLLGGAPAAVHTLLTLCGVWQELKGPQHMATTTSSSSGGCGGGTRSGHGGTASSGGVSAGAAAASAAGMSSGARTSSGGAALLLAAAGMTADRHGGLDDLDSGDNPNFRYLPAVLDRLGATSTRLLALARWEQLAAPGDAPPGVQPAPLPAQWQRLQPCAAHLAQMMRVRLQQLLSEEQLQQLLEQVAASGTCSQGPDAASASADAAAAASAAQGGEAALLQDAEEQLQMASRACSLVKLPSDPWGLESCLAANCFSSAVPPPEHLPADVVEGLEEVAAAAAVLYEILEMSVESSEAPSKEGRALHQAPAQQLNGVPPADLASGVRGLCLFHPPGTAPEGSSVGRGVVQPQPLKAVHMHDGAGAEVTAWLSQVQLLAAQAKQALAAAH